jgi:hypothetical protein
MARTAILLLDKKFSLTTYFNTVKWGLIERILIYLAVFSTYHCILREFLEQ